MRKRALFVTATALGLVAGCGDDAAGTTRDAGGPPPGVDAGTPPAFDGSVVPPPPPLEGWPTPNEYAWHGRWTPTSFPLPGLLDDEYFDMHTGRDGRPTPVLPPGQWDYTDADNDLANWRVLTESRGRYEMLLDRAGNHFGWQWVGLPGTDPDYAGGVAYFEGSLGTDLVDLGPLGRIYSYGSGDLRDGPDVLVFQKSWSLHFNTGSTAGGGANDDDLLVAGCGENPDGSFDVATTTIHMGPGSDWAFVRDIERAGIDMGNGNGGVTSVLDPLDGHDLAVFRGNTLDFRCSGGAGNDTFVWYVDDNVMVTTWLGPNFFGGGEWGDALWGDPGTDRLVMAVPTTTTIVTGTPLPAGSLYARVASGGFVDDGGTGDDTRAHYCIECGTGPGGRKTVILEYVSADMSVMTGYFFLTAIEQLQVGVGPGARVFRIDDVAGGLVEDATLTPFTPPSFPEEYCR